MMRGRLIKRLREAREADQKKNLQLTDRLYEFYEAGAELYQDLNPLTEPGAATKRAEAQVTEPTMK